jgi:hypothetical protein
MLVVFQNRIVYMPSMPPGSRRERIKDYKSACKGVAWDVKRIHAADGTELSLCVANERAFGDDVVIVYFQG